MERILCISVIWTYPTYITWPTSVYSNKNYTMWFIRSLMQLYKMSSVALLPLFWTSHVRNTLVIQTDS